MYIDNIEIYGVIYIIKNKVNNKMYIGQTTKGFDKRYETNGKEWWLKHHNQYLVKSFKKYGIENFEFLKCYDIAFSQIELDIKEEMYIKLFETCSRNKGYNSRSGGLEYKFNEEAKRNMSKKMLGFDIEKYSEDIVNRYVNNKEDIIRISSSYGVNDSVIVRVLKKNGIKTRNNSEVLLGYDISLYKERITELFNRGLNTTEIISELNLSISYSALHKYLKQWGLNRTMSENKLGRFVGKDNPSSVIVKVYDINKTLIKEFDTITDCANWMVENNISNTINTAKDAIAVSNKKDKPYKKQYYFKKYKQSRATTE